MAIVVRRREKRRMAAQIARSDSASMLAVASSRIKNVRIDQQRPGDGKPLPLAAGKARAAFAQVAFIGEGQPHDEAVGVGLPGGRQDFFRDRRTGCRR